MKNLAVMLRTVRHLKPVQIRWRIRSALRARICGLFPDLVPRKLQSAERGLLPLLWESPLLGRFACFRRERAELRTTQADGVMRSEFRLSNRSFRFDGGVDWHRDDILSGNRLAGFELHYQGYLEDLALAWQRTRDRRYVSKWEDLVCSWIQGNPPRANGFSRFSWSPYVISERLRNWLSSCYWLRGEISAGLKASIEKSFARQVAFLAGNLEQDLQGNHLLQNLCGALVGACFLGGREAPSMRGRMLVQIAQGLHEQILADGMHQERSFSYHVKVLTDLLEVLTLARHGAFDSIGETGSVLVQQLADAVARMTGMVAATCAAVGDLPLMNDSEEVSKRVADWVVARGSDHSPPRLPGAGDRSRGSGYLVGSTGPWGAVLDVGPPGPAHQMGHSHADHLGFELWCGGEKLICDLGNPTYRKGEKRQWYRGTAAHNTVRIDKQDSLELWASFRVGARPKRHAGEVIRENRERVEWYGEHDAYRKLPGSPMHRRRFCMAPDHVCVLDQIVGSGNHFMESFIHFSPGVEVQEWDEQNAGHFAWGQVSSALELPRALKNGEASAWRWVRRAEGNALAEGLIVALRPGAGSMRADRQSVHYAPALCVEKASTCLRLAGECRLPLEFGWVILLGNGQFPGAGPALGEHAGIAVRAGK